MTNRLPFYIELHSREILQINATVIAGLLILLAISDSLLPSTDFHAQPPKSDDQSETLRYQAEIELEHAQTSSQKLSRVFITLALMTFFITSSFLALINAGKQHAVPFMAAGFVGIFVTFVFLSVVNYNFTMSTLGDSVEKFKEAQDAAKLAREHASAKGLQSDQALNVTDSITIKKG